MNKKIKIYQTLLITCLCSWISQGAHLKAQSSTIQKRIYLPKSNNAYSRDIVETTPGNFVLIGQSIDSVGNQLENHLTLVGVDHDGNVQWQKSYGSNKFRYMRIGGTSKYVLKHNGFLYSALSVIDSNLREPGTLTKFNFNGDTIWQKKYYEPNPTAMSFFTSVSPSVDNGFLITGSIQTNTPGFNGHPTVGLYLLKTDANGTKLWDKTIYKSNLDLTQIGVDVVQDSTSKKIIIVGYQDINSGGAANVMILDSLGNVLIQKGQGSGTQFFGGGLMNLIQTKDKNFLAAGGVDYLPSSATSFLVKFDTNANIIFSKEYDTVSYGNGIVRIIELDDGTIITGGAFEITNKYTNGLNYLSRVMKLDQSGNFLWKKYFDNYTDTGNQDFLSGMCFTSNKEIVFTSFCECVKPAPVTFMFYRTDTNYCDVNAVACYNVTGIAETEQALAAQQFMLYPNPATNKCVLKWKGDFQFKTAEIELRNILGELVFKEEGINLREYLINTQTYADGVYVLRVLVNNQFISERKLVIVH